MVKRCSQSRLVPRIRLLREAKAMKIIIPLLLLLPVVAFAGELPITITDLSTTLNTSPVQCAPSDGKRSTFYIENPAGSSNSIGYCIGNTPGTSNACVPSVGAAGTSTLTAGVADFFPPGSAPRQAVQCIAANGSNPVTIRSGQ